MRIQYLKNILAGLALCTGFSACNKKLDLKATDTIDTEKAFRNVADINLGIIGAYQGVSFTYIRSSALMSDECMLPKDNSIGKYVATYRWQNDPSNSTITDPFPENYVVINRVNNVLGAIDIVPTKPAEAALKERYRGELLALRAYCHFDLLRNFAAKYEAGAMGVPYMEQSVIGSPARDNYEVVLGNINRDLAAAKKLLPEDFTDRTRITRTAVSAIQARVALYEKKWPQAAAYATEAIDAVPLTNQAEFLKIWTDKSLEEVIWKNVRMVADNDADIPFIGDFFYDVRGRALYVPSFEWTRLFDQQKDIRFEAYVMKNPRTETGYAPFIVNKYNVTADTKNLSDHKLFRTAEMYLIRAEARAQQDNLTGAADDLNALRNARITGYTAVTFSNKTAGLQAINEERFKELAFEGHRYYDLRRNNQSVTREPADAVNAIGSVLLQPDNYLYVFPIPDMEVKANRNMKQNTGY
ncbi:RagB/SusD family nutrient uptake outer membrane protein [Chitinophaga nivalis]|uniref:RagB/SusD family nutrient uptake outer membrane protein n=1 Tax=Chitinophaga nivalis TaxID=2991709 RepID=A0ABT3IGX9_9BACT|nr:RagB/SusD family nutrient uptake outer membrane protein [Chitinophaga nivalis]MCW3467099.1 RagB/SusD family nutrient uptake outer membrane protein [Chitinophaga nivalis]MCW3483210.1 RagB/SusD family nutrient uptake outer membrane protein [Chitinophaga nivalis]